MMPSIIVSRGPEGVRFERELAELLAREGFDVVLTPDLYSIAEDSPLWPELAALPGPVAALLWLHPRPAEWLLRHHGVGADGLRTFDLAIYETPEAALAAVLGEQEQRGPCAPDAADAGAWRARSGAFRELEAPTSPRWYPVRDDDRCTHCLHCYQFCLFGVYAADAERRVRVTNPDNCKAGCPACARICPASAIMFPRYGGDDAIRGAPGRLVTLDADAARMFRERVAGRQRGAQGDAEALLEEIDALIDELDARTAGGPR